MTSHGIRTKFRAEYEIWAGLNRRCYTPSTTDYALYGGRGIEVTERWRRPHGFAAFLADMGPRPSATHSIDRIDVDGNYAPENCRWASREEQTNNTRRCRYIEAYGQRHTIAQWERRLRMSPGSVGHRIAAGWSELDAVTVAKGARRLV